MGRQYHNRTVTSTSTPKQKSQFTALPVVQPKLSRHQQAELPESRSGTSIAVDPFAQLKATMAVQAKLTIGQPNDKYEREADRVARDVVQRLHTPITNEVEPGPTINLKPYLQRSSAIAGGEASTELESSINRAKGGGKSLDTDLQRSMGSAMGADFSNVKIHTDRTSDQLNRSIQARAFTTGNNVFFKKGEYSPDSKSGQELIAHELTHVVQQKGASHRPTDNISQRRLDNVIQPLRQHPDGNHYSSATPKPHDDYKADNKDDAFFTAISSGSIGGGHTTVFMEYFKGGASMGDPVVEQVDLFVSGTVQSGSGSSGSGLGSDVSGQGTKGSSGSSGTSQTGSPKGKITIHDNPIPASAAIGKMASKGKGNKKTWRRTYKDVVAAKSKVSEVKTACEKDEYKYYLFGQGPAKGVLNCARFGQWVLKAGGVPIHIGFWKLPSSITKASETDESIQTVVSVKDLEAHDSKLPKACHSKSGFATVMKIDNAVKGSDGYIEEIGKNLEKYHKFTDPGIQAYALEQALGYIGGYLDYLQKNSGNIYPERKRIEYLQKDFTQGLDTEVQSLKDQVSKSPDSLWAGLIGGVGQLPSTLKDTLKIADKLFKFGDLASLKDVQVVPSKFPSECQTQSDFVEAMKIKKKSVKGLDEYVESMGRNLEKYHKFTDPELQVWALDGFVSAMETYLDKLQYKVNWTSGKSSDWYDNAYEKHERVLYLRGAVSKGFKAEIKAIKEKVTQSPDSPWKDFVGKAEQYKKLASDLLQ